MELLLIAAVPVTVLNDQHIYHSLYSANGPSPPLGTFFSNAMQSWRGARDAANQHTPTSLVALIGSWMST